MQLFAFDKKNQLIFARHAKKGENYVCTECGCRVRLRGGLHRKNHYYHLEPNRTCRQSQKSLEHIQVQSLLFDIIPVGDCFLEKRFESIGRIADVVWESKKLIFEVQCSLITAEEVRGRNRDYASEGYKVIWILHDQRFNKWRVTAAESFLWNLPHFFTNMDVHGEGIIYDQIDLLDGGTRRKIESYFPVNLSSVKDVEFEFFVEKMTKVKKKIPRIIEEKRRGWGLRFTGDVLDLLSVGGGGSGSGDGSVVVGGGGNGNGSGDGSARESKSESVNLGLHAELNDRFWRAISALLEFEKGDKIDSWVDWVKVSVKVIIYRWVVRPYLIWFQIALERHCR